MLPSFPPRPNDFCVVRDAKHLSIHIPEFTNDDDLFAFITKHNGEIDIINEKGGLETLFQIRISNPWESEAKGHAIYSVITKDNQVKIKIYVIVVPYKFQCKGYGSDLLAYIMAHANVLQCLKITAVVNSLNGFKLFSKANFVPNIVADSPILDAIWSKADDRLKEHSICYLWQRIVDNGFFELRFVHHMFDEGFEKKRTEFINKAIGMASEIYETDTMHRQITAIPFGSRIGTLLTELEFNNKEGNC